MNVAKQMFRRLGLVALVAAGIGAGASADAEPTRAVAVEPAAVSPAIPKVCTEAAIVDVQLRRAEAIDEIRVLVAGDSPEHGAARVEVSTGEFDRILHVRGGSHGLAFSTPLSGRAFQVTVVPELSAPRSACIDSIELRSGGRLVAAVKP